MDPSLKAEIIGDWNNLKGTEYHFAYALWRLLHEQHVALEFYRGNDLLACATPPPHPEDTLSGSRALHIQGQFGDHWIQLKATTTAWTPTRLLEDNLLLNFICNALTSEARERSWHVQLISQAEVRRSDMLAFTEDPQHHPLLASKFDKIIGAAQYRWEQGGNLRPDDTHVRELAYAILRQLAQQQPTHLDTLKAQIDLALAYRYLTPRLVEQTRRLLLGGLLNDAASGPHHACTYDSAWLDATAGKAIRPTGIFDLQPGDACDLAVRDACETLTTTSVAEQQFVVRSILADEFARFLSSPYTVFVLVGDSGVGKSWALADWMMHGLAGRVRLLIPGTELDLEQQRELSALVAGRLRPYSAVSQQDDELLLRLEAAAREHRRGPLILALDDLQPTGDIEIYRRSLLRLVSQCRVRGVKLVLACQTQVWDMYRLERAVPVSDRYDAQAQRFSRIAFSPQSGGVSDALTHDFSDSSEASHSAGEPSQRTLPMLATDPPSLPYTLALGDFTPEEQQQVLASRLSAPAMERATFALRAAPFLSLRRPYLLDLYLRQYGQRFSATSYSAVPVDVDALVDSHINDLLSRVADATTIDEEVVRSAFKSLASALWSARPNGISLGHAEGCLTPILGGRSQGTLDAMRRAGLLTSRGQVRFAETQVAERLFARNLVARQAAGEDIIDDLLPEPDAGVAAALLRVLPTNGAVAFAEELLRRDERWSRPVASGLAQVDSPDTGVLALLTIMTRPQENVIGDDGCEALGALAARDACALKWVTAMYVAAHAMERYRGARALAVTFEYAPERVEAAVRLRLAVTVRIDVSSSSGREEREEWLRQSLTPLLNVRHARAAAVARRILARCAAMRQEDRTQALRRFEREMNEIRGQIALFDVGEMEQIQTDVRSSETALRVRAAVALRSAMLDEPERVQDVICDAISCEQDPEALTQLLWATSRLSETCPDQLLDALTNNTTLLNWAAPSETAGQALATLSNLATRRSERVAQLLPQRLDAYPAWSRAWLAEGLAYAWWVCAERAPNARAQLERFVTPELLDVPEECQIFAWKAAALAQLGLLCLQSEISTSELSGLQILYPGTQMQFCFVHTAELVQRHARDLVNSPEISQLIDLLRRCEGEFARVPTNPLQRALVSARHTCAEQCFEMLIALANVHPDPIPLISDLGSDWHTFGAARRLLEAGRTEQPIQAYVRTLCDAPIPVAGRTVQAIGEWERCLQRLADHADTPQANVGAVSANLHNSPFAADDRAAAMAQRIAARPDDLLSILDSMLETERTLVTLYFLAQHACSWPALLLARVYARMFDLRPLTIHEARQLCADVLSALTVLPDSAERDEYAHVYSAIASWLSGTPCDVMPTEPSASLSSPIRRSHAAAVTMIHDAFQRLPNRPDAAHLLDALAASRGAGWWEVEGVRLHGDTVSIGSGSVLYVFPAARLALCGLSSKDSWRDTAATFLTERIQVQELLSHYHYELDPRRPYAEGYLEKHVGQALDALSDPTLPQTRDERLYMAQSTLLRRLGRLEEAIEILERGLRIFGEFPSIRASMLYDLGCAYALCGRDDDCRDVLQAAAQLAPFTGMRYQWLFEDPELAAVRDKPWLRVLGQSQVSSHEET